MALEEQRALKDLYERIPHSIRKYVSEDAFETLSMHNQCSLDLPPDVHTSFSAWCSLSNPRSRFLWTMSCLSCGLHSATLQHVCGRRA
eukprot:8942-Eustigmatos_ZCMA.PRE.1